MANRWEILENANPGVNITNKSPGTPTTGDPKIDNIVSNVDDYYNQTDLSDFLHPGQKDRDKTEWLKDWVGYYMDAANTDKILKFEKMMSDTGVQRRVKDLEAAGINPALAIMNGGNLQAADTTSVSPTKFNRKSKITESKANPIKDTAGIIAALALAAKFLV